FFAHGNLDKAKAEARQVIKYWSRVGEKNQQCTMITFLALIAQAESDLPSAVVYGQKALELAREMRIPVQIAWNLALVGIFQYQEGNVQKALQHLRESLEMVRVAEVGNRIISNIFVFLGGLFVEKKTQTAVHILAFSESLARLSAVHRDPILDKPYYDRFLSTARAKLSEAEFTSAWADGS